MFDRTFFRFALGLAAIIAASVSILYLVDHINGVKTDQTASVR